MDRFTLKGALIGVMLMTLTACGATGSPLAQTDPVSIQLSWQYTTEFSGFYVADQNGLYSKEHIDASILEGGFDASNAYIDPVEAVTSAQAQFGITSAGRLLTSRAEGKPLVAIATIWQRSPVVLISLAEKNIVRPEDLRGKIVAFDPNSSAAISILTMFKDQGIALSDITQAPGSLGVNELVAGDVDVIDGFITNEPITLEAQGHDVNLILASDYGVEIYSNVIFTTEDLIKQNPDLVERFLRASLKGFQATIDDPDKAATATVTVNAETDSGVAEQAALASVPLLSIAGSRVGMMSDEVWQTTYDSLVHEQLLERGFDMRGAYTLDFLNRIYQ